MKPDIQIIQKRGLSYSAGNDGRIERFKPWLGDAFSFLYDTIMERSIFPKKFNGDIRLHFRILERELKDVHGSRILELATGSGNAVRFLSRDNRYTGTDISPGLLRKAEKRFRDTGFEAAGFYVTRADDLPFADDTFDLCLCILSLNFFDDIKNAVQEMARVLVPAGLVICSVPVPERNQRQTNIRGNLLSEAELAGVYRECGFRFEGLPDGNGVLLYFKATLTGEKNRI